MIGTWRVISYSVRWNTTKTPEGWADFSFGPNGQVTQTVTRQEMQTSHHGDMHWQQHDAEIIVYENNRPTWYVKHLGVHDMVLSQGNSAELSYTLHRI